MWREGDHYLLSSLYSYTYLMCICLVQGSIIATICSNGLISICSQYWARVGTLVSGKVLSDVLNKMV